MNKDEFRSITSDVIAELVNKLTEDGLSSSATLATTLTLTLFASKLIERLYGHDEIEIER